MATPRVCAALVLAALSSLCLLLPRAPAAEPVPLTTSIRLDSPDRHHEDEIRQTLVQPTQIEMVDMPLGDVVHYLSDLHKIQILIDHKALEDAGASADTPITFQVENISLESALALMLHDHGLTWIIRNGVLMITSDEHALDTLSTRLYPVRDLVHENSEGVADYQPLKEMIQTTIAPTIWDEAGGSSSIQPFAGLLVISTAEEVHRELEGLLLALRKAKSLASEQQPNAEVSSSAPVGEPVVTPAK